MNAEMSYTLPFAATQQSPSTSCLATSAIVYVVDPDGTPVDPPADAMACTSSSALPLMMPTMRPFFFDEVSVQYLTADEAFCTLHWPLPGL